MPFNGSGVFSYTPPPPYIFNTTISETEVNATLTEIGNALSLVLVRDGQAAMTGTLNMGTQSIINLGAGLVSAPSLRWNSADGFYSPSANVIRLALAGSDRLEATASTFKILPDTTNAALTIQLDQNATTYGWTVINGSGGASGLAQAKISNGSDSLTLSHGGSGFSGGASTSFVTGTGAGGLQVGTSASGNLDLFTVGSFRFRIDTSGRWLNVGNTQPRFFAFAASDDTATGSTTAIAFGTEVFDRGGVFDAGGTDFFTVPVTGTYQVSAGVAVFNGTGTAFSITVSLQDNGSTIIFNNASIAAGVTHCFPLSIITELTSGHNLKVVINGGDSNISASSPILAGRGTFFSAALLY